MDRPRAAHSHAKEHHGMLHLSHRRPSTSASWPPPAAQALSGLPLQAHSSRLPHHTLIQHPPGLAHQAPSSAGCSWLRTERLLAAAHCLPRGDPAVPAVLPGNSYRRCFSALLALPWHRCPRRHHRRCRCQAHAGWAACPAAWDAAAGGIQRGASCCFSKLGGTDSTCTCLETAANFAHKLSPS